MTKQYQQLSSKEGTKRLELLSKFENLFGGTLVTRKTIPVDPELKDNAKPVCLQSYPIPRVQESMFRKE